MEQSNFVLIKSFLRRGYIVDLISVAGFGPLKPLLQSAGVNCLSNTKGFGKSLSTAAAIFDYRRKFGPVSVIQVGHNAAATISILLSRFERRMLKIHFHHDAGFAQSLKWKIQYFLSWATFHKITFCTRFIMKQAIALFPRIRRKSLVVFNPFEMDNDTDQTTSESGLRNTLKIPKDAKVLGNAGWLIERKRFDVFLEVAARLVHENPNNEFRFIIAGDGPCKAKLEQRAKELRISEMVEFVGWVQDMSEFYRALDVLLFSADIDALGRVPIEALIHRVPFVASILEGGISEVFPQSLSRFILSEHNSDLMVELVTEILEQSDRQRKLIELAREKVQVELSPNNHFLEIERLLFS